MLEYRCTDMTQMLFWLARIPQSAGWGQLCGWKKAPALLHWQSVLVWGGHTDSSAWSKRVGKRFTREETFELNLLILQQDKQKNISCRGNSTTPRPPSVQLRPHKNGRREDLPRRTSFRLHRLYGAQIVGTARTSHCRNYWCKEFSGRHRDSSRHF